MKPLNRWLLIDDPPLPKYGYRLLRRTSHDLLKWFASLPKPLAVFLVAKLHVKFNGLSTEEFSAIRIAVHHVAGICSHFELRRVIEGLPRAQLGGYSVLDIVSQTHALVATTTDPRPFLVAIAQGSGKQIFVGYFERQLDQLFIASSTNDEEFQRQLSDPEIRLKFLSSEVWPLLTRVTKEVRSVFAPPMTFQPTTPAEWLIAADMLEDAGEIRAEAIRVAVKGESDEKIFATIYKPLPPDLLA